ncbi:hypothetical protein VNO80_18565 [Phaseolus coccineus]|uniref:Uncharacterized protein n=1 Tax=Phaseolus coccineus TaxID=3886 RepID=A0AAN9MFL2_PHACN
MRQDREAFHVELPFFMIVILIAMRLDFTTFTFLHLIIYMWHCHEKMPHVTKTDACHRMLLLTSGGAGFGYHLAGGGSTWIFTRRDPPILGQSNFKYCLFTNLNPVQLGRVRPTLWIVKSQCTHFIDRGLMAFVNAGGGGGSTINNSSQVTDAPLCNYAIAAGVRY